MQLFISHLARCLRTCRFSEPPFDPPEPRNTVLEKHSVSRLPYLFARLHLLSSDFLHLLPSPSLIFSLLTFSTSEFLPGCAFSISPYCRKFSFQTSFDDLRLYPSLGSEAGALAVCLEQHLKSPISKRQSFSRAKPLVHFQFGGQQQATSVENILLRLSVHC